MVPVLYSSLKQAAKVCGFIHHSGYIVLCVVVAGGWMMG